MTIPIITVAFGWPGVPHLVYQLQAGIPTVSNDPFSASQGDTFQLTFPILTTSGSPVVFSSPVAAFAMIGWPRPVEGATPIITKTPTLTQQLIAGAPTWVAYVSFVHSDTTSSAFVGGHYFELGVTDGSVENTVATGAINFSPTIIRP